MKSFNYRCISITHPYAVLIGILMVFVSAVAVQAQDDMCIPQIGGAITGLPNIDGIVENFGAGSQTDPGWKGATRFNLSADGGTTKSAIFQVGRTASSVYISTVIDTPSPGSDNTIVLVLSTNDNPANDWRIHIQPFDVGMNDGSDQVPLSITYWRNSDPVSGWNSAGAAPNTASPGFWLKDNTRFSKSGSRWALEIEIPRENNIANAGSDNKIYFTNTGTFSLYFNILSTSTLLGTFFQDPWPPNHIITTGTSSFLTRNTPVKSQWGTVSFNQRSDCTGVSLDVYDVGLKDPNNPSTITYQAKYHNPPGGFSETLAQCNNLPDNHQWPGTQGPVNKFVAKPLNEMTTTAKVSAQFRIANWGIPGPNDWRPIGSVAGGLSLTPPTTLNNPTPEVPILTGNYGDLTATWQLSYKQSCLYSKTGYLDTYIGDQCILVDLDSTDPNTRFLNKSVRRNVQFGPASVFSKQAAISAIGYGRPPEGRKNHEFLIVIDKIVQAYEKRGDFYIPKGWKVPILEKRRAAMQPAIIVSGKRLLPDWRRISWDKLLIPEALVKEGLNEAMTWVARGYRKTGNFLIINNRKYEYSEYVGGYGYLTYHKGLVKKWTESFMVPDAAGGEKNYLKKTKQAGLYNLQVPPNKIRNVLTRIQAIEERKKPRRCFDFSGD